MLIYISIDRYICIIYQNICSILKRKKYQIVYLFYFFFFNSLYYIPVLFTFDLTKLTINISVCSYSINSKYITYMDMSYIFLVLTLMLLFSCLFIYFIFSSHKRNLTKYTSTQNEYFKKDLRLSVSSILFNMMYIIFFLPDTVLINFFPNIHDTLYAGAFFTAFLNYSTSFYVLMFSNFKFRKEVETLFGLTKRKIPQSQLLQVQPQRNSTKNNGSLVLHTTTV